MPETPHVERHFQSPAILRDIVIGMSDGLTVPFALAAGLTGLATASSAIVTTAGFAEIAAGAIAMGLGGYLAAKSDAEYYASERLREEREIVERPEDERQEIFDVFRAHGLPDDIVKPIVDALQAKPTAWVDFMMRNELGLEKPVPGRARNSALTIALSYIVGGLVPLFPYILVRDLKSALNFSIAVTLAALLVFGYIKGRFTGRTPMKSALQTALVGSLAATAAFLMAKWIA